MTRQNVHREFSHFRPVLNLPSTVKGSIIILYVKFIITCRIYLHCTTRSRCNQDIIKIYSINGELINFQKLFHEGDFLPAMISRDPREHRRRLSASRPEWGACDWNFPLHSSRSPGAARLGKILPPGLATSQRAVGLASPSMTSSHVLRGCGL